MFTKTARILLGIIAALFAMTTLIWFLLHASTLPKTVETTIGLNETTSTTVSGSASTTSIPRISSHKKTIYIVIDDVGHNMESVRRFLAFPGHLTFSVLPGLSYTREAAKLILEKGQGLILHQPMEAVGGQNPGPGLIRSGEPPTDVTNQLAANISELASPQGVNNHMGSKGTQDEALLETMMQVLKDRNLFFLDSRTTNLSKAAAVARRRGVPCVERDVFLDNEQDRESITKSFQEGLKIAEKRGYAVMIGHAWSTELAQILVDTYPQLIDEGYDFDSLVNHFLGGKGDFNYAGRLDSESDEKASKADENDGAAE